MIILTHCYDETPRPKATWVGKDLFSLCFKITICHLTKWNPLYPNLLPPGPPSLTGQSQQWLRPAAVRDYHVGALLPNPPACWSFYRAPNSGELQLLLYTPVPALQLYLHYPRGMPITGTTRWLKAIIRTPSARTRAIWHHKNPTLLLQQAWVS